jgi:thiol:disulfide interchange protein
MYTISKRDYFKEIFMRTCFFSLLTASFLFSGALSAEQTKKTSFDQSTPLLPWGTDYDQGMNLAKTTSLPVYLFFTGSTWCIWCKKMEADFHNQDAFRQKTVGKFVFIKIELPAGGSASDLTKNLMQKYNVKGVPCIIVLSPDGKELGRFRYQKITPDQYADLVINAATQK